MNLRGQLWARRERTDCVKSGVQGRRGMGSYWGGMPSGASSVLKRFEESMSPSLGDGLEGLSSSTAWDPVPGAGLRPVHLHPPGICIWERKWEISGVEASGGKCPR